MTDTEIRVKGVAVLAESLGSVEAERFITLMLRDPFDYTEWRQPLFEDMSIEEISQEAMFEKFWSFLKQSGETNEGNSYSVTDDDSLLIRSVGSKNQSYKTSKDKVKQYFTRDIPNMSESDFRHNISSYFLNVYKHYKNMQ